MREGAPRFPARE